MVLGLVFAALGTGAGVPEGIDLNAQECGDGDWACLPLRFGDNRWGRWQQQGCSGLSVVVFSPIT